MARIGKADHARILQLVDVEQQKVTEVAAEYGCTPTHIYTLLSKLRRAAKAKKPAGAVIDPPVTDEPAGPAVAATTEAVPPRDLFAAPVASVQSSAPREIVAAAPQPPVERELATVTELPRKGAVSKRGGIGASLAKPGFGLTMRTQDSDETVTPFRSLEDLLSAVKPILRAAARSPDPVWFSIRQIDLSEMEWEAA
jgi:transposase-like protein